MTKITKELEEIRAKIIGAKDEANQAFFEREDYIHLIYGCMLASKQNKPGVRGRRINLSVVAGPGTAKSESARFILEGIKDANFWARQLSKFTEPEYLMGDLDLSKLAEPGSPRVYNTRGKAPDQHVVLLDEIWNAQSGLLQHFSSGPMKVSM